MRVGIFDIETTNLYADSGIILCMSHKPYLASKKTVRTIRADRFESWKTGKSDNREVVENIMKELREYDILVAHNGQYFDKAFLNTSCLKYGMLPELRLKKFIDPVLIARKHLRLHNNTLNALIAHLDIPEKKTPVAFEHWVKAGLDSNTKSMDYIVEHCEKDVIALEAVYDETRKLVKRIDDGGSAW